MVNRTSATVQVDHEGRLYIPKGARKALEIYGVRADLELEITVLNRTDPGDDGD